MQIGFGLLLAIFVFFFVLGLAADFSLRKKSADYHVSHLSMPPNHIDLIVVLGAGTRTDQPVLGDRLHCAEQASQQWPTAKVILTGNDVSSSETTAMKDALMTRGRLNPALLVQDGRAMNTRQSFENLSQNFSSDRTVIVCTNEFHQRRSVALAREYGFQAWASGWDRSRYRSGPALLLRERLSAIKWFIESNYE